MKRYSESTNINTLIAKFKHWVRSRKITSFDIDSTGATSGQVPTADGSGGTLWQTPSGGVLTVTYAGFVTAVTGSTLVPGMRYRITDYVTKINGVYDLSMVGQQGAYLPYATSAEHPFDLIVTATGINTYNENVKAIQHSGDTYFEHSNLASWELKWTHLNDRNQYSFADDNNGKGVIYYMKDEFDNEGFFDFKNIMNLQFALRRVDNTISQGGAFEYNSSSQPNRYGTLADVFQVLQELSIGNNLEFDVESINGTSAIMLLTAITDISKNALDSVMDWTYMLAALSSVMGTTVTLAMLAQLLGTTEQALEAMTERQVIQNIFNADFYYTFNLNLDDTFYDFTSYYNYNGVSEEETFGGAYCWANHIKKTNDALTDGLPALTTIPNGLPLVAFENTEIAKNHSNELSDNCYFNVFGSSCAGNSLGVECTGNRFGNECDGNSFGYRCYSNSFGDNCCNNSFGNLDYANSFGEQASSNSFGNNCNSNLFGDYCGTNSFGNQAYYNSFRSACRYNSFGDLAYSNSLGDDCESNSFGNNCASNSFDYSCDSNSFGNNCDYNSFSYNCDHNSLGNNCDHNSLGGGVSDNQITEWSYNNIFEEGVLHVYLTSSTSGAQDNMVQNVKVCQGVCGTSSSNRLTISATRGLGYQVEYKVQGSTQVFV